MKILALFTKLPNLFNAQEKVKKVFMTLYCHVEYYYEHDLWIVLWGYNPFYSSDINLKR
jgi:hypothetical protein